MDKEFRPISLGIIPESKPFAWGPALLSFLVVGGGQAVQGHTRRALGLLLLGSLAPVILLQLAPFVPPTAGSLVGGLAGVLLIRLWIAWDAGNLPYAKLTRKQQCTAAVLLLSGFLAVRLGAQLLFDRNLVVGRSYWIPSESSMPTLQPGDYIVANCRPPRVERGDTVVFRTRGVMNSNYESVIKRVVALAGDRVEVRSGRLYLNGQPQQEPYLYEPTIELDYPEHIVRAGHFFALGDNRNNSHDSRFIGDIPEENIQARAVWIFWSNDLKRIGPVR